MNNIFANLDRLSGNEPVTTREHIIKAPFNYVGGKSRSAKHILPHLPLRGRYIEVFGGSGVILLNREKEEFEVYNDRFSGVVDFYQCIRDKELCDAMIKYLECMPMAREEFATAKACTSTDKVIRAASWFYKMSHSFGGLGRNFGRSLNKTVNKLPRKLQKFDLFHKRYKDVLIENLDWKVCLRDFDHPNSVFYLDPPYLDTTGSEYAYDMKEADHEDLCETIFDLEGYVALSSYDNDLYNGYNWDDIISWDVHISIESGAHTESNNLLGRENFDRGSRKEFLYIKR